jgi:hypothetical protein
MKRIRILGLCLMVACAFAAVSVASSASAATFGTCFSLKHGEYTNSNCSTKSVKAKKGSFEFAAAGSCYSDPKKGNFTENACKTVALKKGKPSHKGSFELAPLATISTSSGPASLSTPGFGTIECKASTGGGAIESGKVASTITKFTGCETAGAKCQNTATEGEIDTNPLLATLTEPTAGDAQSVITPKTGTYEATFGCTGVAFIRTFGNVGGKDSPTNTMGTSTTLTFETGKEQNLLTEFSSTPTFEPGTVLGPFPSEQAGVFTNVSSVSMEIHTP